MNKDSRGFTLIELIVVIVILGIMAAVISISVSTIPATRAKGCASTISTTLDRARVGSLTHAQVSYMTISQNSSGAYEIACFDNGTHSTGGYSGGTEIGEHCVIGSNSVVTRDTPPWTISAGAPAKVIREIEPKTGAAAGDQ